MEKQLTDINILCILICSKLSIFCVRGGICHAIRRYAKANKKYTKDYDKNKESIYLKYWEVNNLYEWAMSQKFHVNGFKLVENTSQFKEDFINSYNEDSDEGYFLEIDVNLPFLPERMRIKNAAKLVANLNAKINMLFT